MSKTPETDKFNSNWDFYREPWRAIEFAKDLEMKLNEARVLLSEKTIQYEITQEELEFVKRIRCDAITIETDRLAEEFKRNTLPDDVKLDILFGFTRKLEHALDELQEKYDTLAVENMLEVNEICKQRDAAIKELKEAWLAMDEIEGTDRINEWQNKNAHFLNTDA
jgi:hypothetical protein